MNPSGSLRRRLNSIRSAWRWSTGYLMKGSTKSSKSMESRRRPSRTATRRTFFTSSFVNAVVHVFRIQ
ncbi:tensin-1 isoform X9 [Tachysurus ichikawai]